MRGSHKFIKFIDNVLKTCVKPIVLDPTSPGNAAPETLFQWDAAQLECSRYQMRINYTGEICAQALYAGHQQHTPSDETQEWLQSAQKEEYAHLQWCSQRLVELGSQPSKLDPFFYIGSFCMAKMLSYVSESYNIRFIRETEKQVQAHLEAQKQCLHHDHKSLDIIQQMIFEEQQHHDQAQSRDDRALPKGCTQGMQLVAKGMKFLVKYI